MRCRGSGAREATALLTSTPPSVAQSWCRLASSAIDPTQRRPRAPRRIVLIRHGQSQGNVDETAYVTTADWRIPLTVHGRQQAANAGQNLRDVLGERPTMWYVSPYVRTQQTLTELVKRAGGHSLGVREEPRIAEQQFGNFQNVEEVLAAKEERARFGRFWYRFPSGESGLDVFNRTTSFISTLFRDMSAIHNMLTPDHAGGGDYVRFEYNNDDSSLENDDSSLDNDEFPQNIVIVTHGLTLRLFLMRWLRWYVSLRNLHLMAVFKPLFHQNTGGF